ncbi:hypothetical protein A2U01_0088708, partial [Trifolium medium]|nr:hypothetical protein [Trifolium medium]
DQRIRTSRTKNPQTRKEKLSPTKQEAHVRDPAPKQKGASSTEAPRSRPHHPI